MESLPPPSPTMIINLLSIFLLFHLPTSSSSSTPIPFPIEALPSKSGYLMVNPSSNSSIFYTYYEAQKPISSLSKTPLLIWLQGGPGCSSMIGNFYELGPWRVNRSVMLEPNEGAWNRVFGLLFLDNPVGAGFSIASSVEDIPRDQNSVAEHLFVAITSFIALDPVFKSRPIYITGESYAGKYVPAIGYYILLKNPKLPEDERVKLEGVAIGNGLTDPVNQVKTHAMNAYYSGLINELQKTQIEEAQEKVVKLVMEMKWGEAADARNGLFEMLQNMTGLATLLDMRRKTPYESHLVGLFLSKVEVKRELGVKPLLVWKGCSDVVEVVLHDDVMKSVRYMVEMLVKEIKVLVYQGQCDLKDGVVSVEAWMNKLKWEGIGKFQGSERKVWNVKGEIAGYVQKWGGLSHAVVLGAGHYVPTDQPLNSQSMIEDWVLERGVFAS